MYTVYKIIYMRVEVTTLQIYGHVICVFFLYYCVCFDLFHSFLICNAAVLK